MTSKQIERLRAWHRESVESGDNFRLHCFVIGAYTIYDNIDFSDDYKKIYLNNELISDIEMPIKTKCPYCKNGEYNTNDGLYDYYTCGHISRNYRP